MFWGECFGFLRVGGFSVFRAFGLFRVWRIYACVYMYIHIIQTFSRCFWAFSVQASGFRGAEAF